MNVLFNAAGHIPISLGFNCHVSMFIERLGRMDNCFYERQIFDWLGTPMWGIYELVKNDFNSFLSDISVRSRYTYKKEAYPVNTKYDISFLHDFGVNVKTIPPNVMSMAAERYGRRIERIRSLLSGQQKLLFIRLERDPSDKLVYPESAESIRGESESMVLFADLIKAKGLVYTIVYMTFSEPTRFDAERRICYVNFPKIDPIINFTNDRIMQIIKANTKFIKECVALQV
uniref:Papain-like cysteine peptidase n=1 Tax=viral metagenome TaxID=1070528 RepID=A0A6C0KY87_9ZZZZ